MLKHTSKGIPLIAPTGCKQNNHTLITETLDKARSTKECRSLKLHVTVIKTRQSTLPRRTDRPEEGWSNLNKPTKESTRFFGIIVYENLIRQYHIDNLCKKLSSALQFWRKISSFADRVGTSLIAYYSLLALHLRYGIVVLGSALPQTLNTFSSCRKEQQEPYLD